MKEFEIFRKETEKIIREAVVKAVEEAREVHPTHECFLSNDERDSLKKFITIYKHTIIAVGFLSGLVSFIFGIILK